MIVTTGPCRYIKLPAKMSCSYKSLCGQRLANDELFVYDGLTSIAVRKVQNLLPKYVESQKLKFACPKYYHAYAIYIHEAINRVQKTFVMSFA